MHINLARRHDNSRIKNKSEFHSIHCLKENRLKQVVQKRTITNEREERREKEKNYGTIYCVYITICVKIEITIYAR